MSSGTGRPVSAHIDIGARRAAALAADAEALDADNRRNRLPEGGNEGLGAHGALLARRQFKIDPGDVLTRF